MHREFPCELATQGIAATFRTTTAHGHMNPRYSVRGMRRQDPKDHARFDLVRDRKTDSASGAIYNHALIGRSLPLGVGNVDRDRIAGTS